MKDYFLQQFSLSVAHASPPTFFFPPHPEDSHHAELVIKNHVKLAIQRSHLKIEFIILTGDPEIILHLQTPLNFRPITYLLQRQ